MAIATMLVKPEVNYALLGKLCLGVAVELESFVSTMRSKSAVHMARMESGFLSFVTFQINIQRALSLYFLSRSLWNSSEYGVAIAALSEATIAMRTRTSLTGRGKPTLWREMPFSSSDSLILHYNHTRLTRNRRERTSSSSLSRFVRLEEAYAGSIIKLGER